MNVGQRALGVLRNEGVAGAARKVTYAFLTALDASALRTRGSRADLARAIMESELGSEERALLARNEMFKDRHRGRRCFVIGNGPSLRHQDLSPLTDEVTFAANGFWKHDTIDRWQPTYYLLFDPLFFDGSAESRVFFAQLTGRVALSTFFVPLHARDVVGGQALLPPERTYYLTGSPMLWDGWQRWPDLTRPLPLATTVVIDAILAAMYMGCSPIYLIGLDHDWLSRPSRFAHHFYDGDTIPGDSVQAASETYSFRLEWANRLWRSYQSLARLAATRGVAIVNVTAGGFLDVFERDRYECVVGLEPRPALDGQRRASG